MRVAIYGNFCHFNMNCTKLTLNVFFCAFFGPTFSYIFSSQGAGGVSGATGARSNIWGVTGPGVGDKYLATLESR